MQLFIIIIIINLQIKSKIALFSKLEYFNAIVLTSLAMMCHFCCVTTMHI